VCNEEKEELTIFAVNRNLKEPLDLEAHIYGFEHYRLAEHITLHNADLKAANSAREERVKPSAASGGQLDGGNLEARLPAASLKRGFIRSRNF
jgi:alpha-N-arabinofuranosidase